MLTTSSPSYHHNVFCPTAGTYSSYYYDALRTNSRRSNKRVSLVKSQKPSPPAPTVPEKKPERTTKKKSVRFSDDNDQVRFFYQWQAPKEEKKEEYKLELVNNKKVTNRNNVITLETVDVDNSSPKLSVVGKCHVVNLAFEKHVMVRYTFDSWQTHTDIDAIYRESLVDAYKDRFTFELHTQKNDDDLVLEFAIRYCVNGREFWDNNDGENYSARLHRLQVEKVTKIDKKEPKVAPWSPIKRGSPPLSNATFINPWTTSSFWIPQHRLTQPHDQTIFPSHHYHLNTRGSMPLIS